ncbi:MAG: tetratricopeptide repeat protein [Planctomycetaceae bacterium]|nr:tetratricopeptide repeat protein [Planctomycetaceae bacterium]
MWLAAFGVPALILATAYFWPMPESTGPAAGDSHADLVLSAEPAPIAVEKLREESEQAARQLTERYPKSPAAQRTAATLYQFLKQHAAATSHWEKYIALNPADPDARVQLAKLQMLQGQDLPSQQTLSAALAAGMHSPDVYEQLCVALQRTGDLPAAEERAKEGLDRFPDQADLWIALGQTQLQLGRLEDAKSSIDSAIRIEPQSSAARFAAANICTRLGASAEADEHRRRMEKTKAARQRDRLPFEKEYERTMRGFVSAIFAAMAVEYDAQGESAEAEHWCRRSIELVPDSLEPLRLLVGVYYRQGHIGKAYVVQRRLMELEPGNVLNYSNFANLALQLGRAEEAEAALVQATRVAPQNAQIRRSLAALYMQRGELTKARDAAQRAVALEPSPEGYQVLAAVCRQLGDADAAAKAEMAAQQLQAGSSP